MIIVKIGGGKEMSPGLLILVVIFLLLVPAHVGYSIYKLVLGQEDKLRELIERYQRLFAESWEAMLGLDPDGEVINANPGSIPLLAKGGGAGVVKNTGGHPESFLDYLPQWHIIPAGQVGRRRYHRTALRIHTSGAGNTDTCQIRWFQATFVQLGFYCPANPFHNGINTLTGKSLDCIFRPHIPVAGKYSRQYLGTTDVHRQDG